MLFQEGGACIVKYTVYADYVATVIVGEVEAESAEEAVKKLAGEVEQHIPLCCECEEHFIDSPTLADDGGIYAYPE